MDQAKTSIPHAARVIPHLHDFIVGDGSLTILCIRVVQPSKTFEAAAKLVCRVYGMLTWGGESLRTVDVKVDPSLFPGDSNLTCTLIMEQVRKFATEAAASRLVSRSSLNEVPVPSSASAAVPVERKEPEADLQLEVDEEDSEMRDQHISGPPPGASALPRLTAHLAKCLYLQMDNTSKVSSAGLYRYFFVSVTSCVFVSLIRSHQVTVRKIKIGR